MRRAPRNERVTRYAADVRRKADLQAKADAAEAEAKALTAKLEQIDKEKNAAIAKAAMPVEGLGFGEDVVMFDGFPAQSGQRRSAAPDQLRDRVGA